MTDKRKGLEGFAKYALCAYCNEPKRQHIGPQFQCLFASTYFLHLSLTATPEEYARWQRRYTR